MSHHIALVRERAGMKQAELARRVTWSQAVVSRVEAGDQAISDDKLLALLEAIDTPEAKELAEIVSQRWGVLPVPGLDHPDHTSCETRSVSPRKQRRRERPERLLQCQDPYARAPACPIGLWTQDAGAI